MPPKSVKKQKTSLTSREPITGSAHAPQVPVTSSVAATFEAATNRLPHPLSPVASGPSSTLASAVVPMDEDRSPTPPHTHSHAASPSAASHLAEPGKNEAELNEKNAIIAAQARAYNFRFHLAKIAAVSSYREVKRAEKEYYEKQIIAAQCAEEYQEAAKLVSNESIAFTNTNPPTIFDPRTECRCNNIKCLCTAYKLSLTSTDFENPLRERYSEAQLNRFFSQAGTKSAPASSQAAQESPVEPEVDDVVASATKDLMSLVRTGHLTLPSERELSAQMAAVTGQPSAAVSSWAAKKMATAHVSDLGFYSNAAAAQPAAAARLPTRAEEPTAQAADSSIAAPPEVTM